MQSRNRELLRSNKALQSKSGERLEAIKLQECQILEQAIHSNDLLLSELDVQLLRTLQQRGKLEEYMCIKLPALFTKAYNRMLAEQQCEILLAKMGERREDTVYEYGTFARAPERTQPEGGRSEVLIDIKTEQVHATAKPPNFKQQRPAVETESTAISKQAHSRPSAREVDVEEYNTPVYYLQKPSLEEVSHLKTTQSSEENP